MRHATWLRAWTLAVLLAAGLGAAEASQARVEEALANIMALHRPGHDGLATAWDGNKYVQCRLMQDRSLRCKFGRVVDAALSRPRADS